MREAEHAENLQRLRRQAPGLVPDDVDPAHCTGRAGVRCATPDRLPMVGPVPDAKTMTERFTLLGKSTLPEFGLNATTEFAHREPTRNPWNPAYSCGASSGGSAALVAAGAVPIAHANDGGGSIRIPAACCGLVGLKASRGRHCEKPAVRHLPVNLINEGVVTRSVRDTAHFFAEAEKYYRNPKLPEIGLVEFSLHATAVPLDVWKDPYLVGEKRGETERTSTGVQASWDQIFESGFEFTWVWKDIEIDDEESGESLLLSDAQKRSLRRTGNYNRWDVSYDWQISDRHRLVPGIGYIDRDLDGDAMAEDGPQVSLRHLWNLDRWLLVTRLFYSDLESDETNPIYGEEREMESVGASFTAFYTNPFGLKGWTANASASYFDQDSNIDFYDASFGVLSFAMYYRFD